MKKVIKRVSSVVLSTALIFSLFSSVNAANTYKYKKAYKTNYTGNQFTATTEGGNAYDEKGFNLKAKLSATASGYGSKTAYYYFTGSTTGKATTAKVQHTGNYSSSHGCHPQ